MAETVMNHDEFRKYLESFGIHLNSITDKKVYLHFRIQGEDEINSPSEPLELEGLLLVDELTGKKFSADREIHEGDIATFGEAVTRGKKIFCIKHLRRFFDMGLKEAKDMYERNEDRWLTLLRRYHG